MKNLATKFFDKAGQAGDWLLLISGAFCGGFYFLLARLDGGGPEHITTTLQSFTALLALIFLILLVTALIIGKAAPVQRPLWPAFFIVFGFAAFFRLLFLPQTPWLSNDIYRYLWDGQLSQHGVNPYAFPPEAEALRQFRDATIYPRMDHKSVHSVYPPFLQTLFWLGHQTSRFFALPPIVGLKCLFVFIDLALVAALFYWLALLKCNPRWAVLYAWHPLSVVEIAGSGHTDGVGALLLVLALIFLQKKKFLGVAIFLALGFLVKFIPALFLPFLFIAAWREWGLPNAGRAAALFVLIIMASYAPFLSAGENLWSGLLVYSDKWRFNDGFFALVFTAVHALLPAALIKALMVPAHWEITAVVMTTRRIDLALLVTKMIGGAIFIFIYWRTWWQTFRTPTLATLDGVGISTTILAAFFLLSPTLQPWYLLWILPLLVLGFADASRREINYLLIIFLFMVSATVFLSYWILESYVQGGRWQEPVWVRWVEYGIPAAICLSIAYKTKTQ